MSINYKKLLPTVLRDTKWGSFAEAYQSIITTIKTDKIEPIKDQFDIDKMTATEIHNLAYMFGYVIKSYDGFTSSLHYLRKQIKTIIPRIKNKLIRLGYQYVWYIYNVIGEYLPIDIDASNNFLVNDGYYTEESTSYSAITLDNSLAVTLDDINFESLDTYYGTNYKRTRNVLISYRPMYIENENEYFASNTIKAFNYDLNNIKRASERIIMEHYMYEYIAYGTTPVMHTKTLYSYDQSEESTLKTFTWGTISGGLSGGFNNITEIQIGNGEHADTIINARPSGVANLIETLTISGNCDIIETTNQTLLHVRRKIQDTTPSYIDFPDNTNTYFTELGLWGTTGNSYTSIHGYIFATASGSIGDSYLPITVPSGYQIQNANGDIFALDNTITMSTNYCSYLTLQLNTSLTTGSITLVINGISLVVSAPPTLTITEVYKSFYDTINANSNLNTKIKVFYNSIFLFLVTIDNGLSTTFSYSIIHSGTGITQLVCNIFGRNCNFTSISTNSPIILSSVTWYLLGTTPNVSTVTNIDPGTFTNELSLLCYLKFPKIQFHPDAYSNFQLKLVLSDEANIPTIYI